MDLIGGYRPSVEVCDEMIGADGQLRPAWRQFARLFAGVGGAELAQRWQQAQTLVRENGIAFSAYGDPGDKPRPWELDPWPVLIEAETWRHVGDCLAQRARLWNLILADLYGPQTLLQRGLIPAEVVFAHPGFLRPLHGQNPPGGRFLHFYAADVARGADGQWRVLTDRTEAPSGVGFALENRIVTSRMLPDIFHQCQVERHAPFFIALQEAFAALAPGRRENPRVVLLSQGPQSPNFFEDAYVARYLGYVLAEGGDLTVRNDQLKLKTLAGLLPVDVLWRRPNSESCDPLELATHSIQGTAGLLQTARGGNVAIVNPLGSGLVESPVMLAFLPRLCRELLGEDLAMPNVATRWCGDPADCQFALANLEWLTIRRAYHRRGSAGGNGPQLSRLSTAELAERIRRHPAGYIAQEPLRRSTAPVWFAGELKPAPIALRAYAVIGAERTTVLQGALARVSAAAPPHDGSPLEIEGSKDAWIISDGPVQQVTLLRPHGQAVTLKRGGSELPSRVADNLFWLGRLIERADAAARLLRTLGQRLTGESDTRSITEAPVLLRPLAELGLIEPGFVVEGIRQQLPAIETALPKAALDEQHPASLRSTIVQMFRVASLVRDRISVDCWRIVNRIEQQFRPLPRHLGADLTALLTMLDRMIIDLAAFSGLVTESMTRAQAYRFLDLGRRLERALQIIGLVKSSFAMGHDLSGTVLEALLEVADSLMTYRSRYLANLQLSAVIDLLITDETNPRSLAYQLAMLSVHVEQLPRDQNSPALGRERQLAMTLLHELRMVNVEELLAEAKNGTDGANGTDGTDGTDGGEQKEGGGSRTPAFDALLDRLESLLPELSDAISHRYLIHSGPPQQLAEIRPE